MHDIDIPKDLCIRKHDIPYNVMPSLLYYYQLGLYADVYIDVVYAATNLEFIPPKQEYLEFMPDPPSIESQSQCHPAQPQHQGHQRRSRG